MAEPEPPLGWGELQDPHPGQPSVLPSCSGGGCRGDGTKHLPTPGIRPCISTPFLPGLQTTPSANTPPPPPTPGKVTLAQLLTLHCSALQMAFDPAPPAAVVTSLVVPRVGSRAPPTRSTGAAGIRRAAALPLPSARGSLCCRAAFAPLARCRGTGSLRPRPVGSGVFTSQS